jgi:Zn-dependent metalloprotease
VTTHRCSQHCILPPGLLLKLAQTGSDDVRESALRALSLDHTFRQARAVRTVHPAAPAELSGLLTAAAGGHPQRFIYDQHESEAHELGKLVRPEGKPPVADSAVNDAYDGFGDTYKFYWEVLERNSIDDKGMLIDGMVHYGVRYPNAFWDGEGHMWFGDGDGQMLTQTTKGIDVIGHELTHGVTQYTLRLVYQGQSGALNESISDCMGSLVMQYAKGQTAEAASWLIGADIVGPLLKPALRSMKEPRHPNKHEGQPATMDEYVNTAQDNGGVHTNSGIPNHAFYLIATALGGHAWEGAGEIWYDTMHDPKVKPNASFTDFAQGTLRAAQQRFGAQSKEASAVEAGWEAVKVKL